MLVAVPLLGHATRCAEQPSHAHLNNANRPTESGTLLSILSPFVTAWFQRRRSRRQMIEEIVAIATHGTASNYLQRAPSPSGLADVVDLILDKGLVIDAYVRVAVIGIELVTVDARIVIGSVDTYLRWAEQVNRLDLTKTELAGLDELRDGESGHGSSDPDNNGRQRRR